jgi:hypothetical protein
VSGFPRFTEFVVVWIPPTLSLWVSGFAGTTLSLWLSGFAGTTLSLWLSGFPEFVVVWIPDSRAKSRASAV